jgi:hypothetical protein
MKDAGRYARSAAKQRQWWANMTDRERSEWAAKKAAGEARYRAGRKPKAATSARLIPYAGQER